MTVSNLERRVRELIKESLPLPGKGRTDQRLLRLFEVGREDLSVAKIAEAHWDAVAILAEAGRNAIPKVLYGVWASEAPDTGIELKAGSSGFSLSGQKQFCSGAGMVDRALVTVRMNSKNVMVDLDLRHHASTGFQVDPSGWITPAFTETQTATIKLDHLNVQEDPVIGPVDSFEDWYVRRAGFWQGALGPAACWAGGAAGLLDAAMLRNRRDAHTLAHLGAMDANIWAMQALLQTAGNQIDDFSEDTDGAQILALRVRHLIEQHCTDTLRRFARAYGPFPLACDAEISRRYQELDLFLRQNHAERDLEALGQRYGKSMPLL